MKPNHAFFMQKFCFRLGEMMIFIKAPGRWSGRRDIYAP